MDKEKSNRVWESQDRDMKIQRFVNQFIGDIKNIPKSKQESFTLKKLREFIEEKRLLAE